MIDGIIYPSNLSQAQKKSTMNRASREMYLGITPGQETHRIDHYPIVDSLIGHMLKTERDSIAGRHSVPYVVGRNALHPLLGIYKKEMEGMPVALEKSQLSAQLTKQGSRSNERGLRLQITRENQLDSNLGIPIHHDIDASGEHLQLLEDVLADGLPNELGFVALSMEVAAVGQMNSRLYTLRGHSDDQTCVALPFTQQGARQFAEIVSHALRNDIYN